MTSDFSITFGADMSAFLQSLREMAQSITQVMDAMRGQIASMQQGGEAAKRVTLYGADGMKAWEGATREATGALKEQPKTLSELAESIGRISGKTKPASSALGEMRGQIAKTAVETRKFSETLQNTANFSLLFKNGLGMAQNAAQFLSKPFEEFSKTERAAVRLAPLIGGMQTAKEVCADLRKMAAGTGVSFESLTKHAAKLSSVFTDTNQIKLWTKALQNLQIGTGEDMNEVLNSVIKAKASGRFDAGIMENLASKGINIFPELQAQTGLAKEQILELARAGKLAFSEVETAILSVATGTGHFARQADRLRGTFGGATEEMIDAFNLLLASLAEGPAKVLTPIFKGLTNILGAFDGFPAKAVSIGLITQSLWMFRNRILESTIAVKLLGFARAIKGARAMRDAFLATGTAATTSAAQIGFTGTMLKIFTGVAPLVRIACRGIRYALAGMIPFGIGIAIQLLIDGLISLCGAADECGDEIDENLKESLKSAATEMENNAKALEEQLAGLNKIETGANEASESIKELTSAISELREEEKRNNENFWIDEKLKQGNLTLKERKDLIAQKHGFSSIEEIEEIRNSNPDSRISDDAKRRFLDANAEILNAQLKFEQDKKAYRERIEELEAKENGTYEALERERKIRKNEELLLSLLEKPLTNGWDIFRLYAEAQSLAFREENLSQASKTTLAPPPEKEKQPAAPEKIGGGIWSRIGTERASIGGGRVLNLGFNQALSVAREQLQVLKKIAAAVDHTGTPEPTYA